MTTSCRCAGRDGRTDDHRSGSAASGDVAVFGEALVGLGYHASGDAEVGGEGAGGGKAGADGEVAGGDRGAEAVGEPVRETAGRRLGRIQLKEVRACFGPTTSPHIGPVHRTIVAGP